MVFAMAFFSLEDMFVKRALATLPVGQVLIMLGAAGAIILAIAARARGEAVWSRAIFSRPVWLRNLGELVGTIGFVTALALIPLSTASVILQAAPLVVTMGAALFLGETVGWRRWSATLVGLAGVMLILRPGMQAFDPQMLWAVLGVAGLCLRDLATRRVPRSITTLQLSCWAFASIIPAGFLALLLDSAVAMPEPRVIAELATAFCLGLTAYIAITMAMRAGDLSVVAPFRYTRMVFALILGVLIFDERPDWPTLAGASLIIASGLYTLAREARIKRARPSPVPSAPV